MNLTNVQNIIRQGEGISIEYKKCKDKLPFYDKNATYEFIDEDFFTTVIRLTPDLQENTEKTTINITNLLKDDKNISSVELAQKVGRKLVEKVGSNLTENQLKILLLIEENPKIIKKKMAEILNISTTAIDKNIAKLKKQGKLKRIGPDKGGYWEIINR